MTPGPVVVDLQALQSPDFRGRGIARYAYELAVELEAGHPDMVCRYLLNPDLPPPSDLGPLLGSGKVEYSGVPDSARVLHALSPFELGVPIDRVWPRWAHTQGLRYCATVYDLIPLEHPHPYLEDVRQRLLYTARLEVLRAADALMTISDATGRSLTASLGIDPARLHMVGAGTSRRFTPAESSEEARRLAQEAVGGLEPRFVLYPAGSDGRKNVEALIVGFAHIPEALRSSYQLVIVGYLPPLMVNHFLHVAAREGAGGRVLCPGYVTDDTMLRLYRATELLCFPSLMEGYGLPVAEAMACGAVAIVSDVDPLRDLVAPEARFDPNSSAAIGASIERALSDEAFREASRRHARSATTTWAEVADRTVAVYDELLSRPGRPWRPRRRRVAIVSPFPPLPSGIAKYSFRLVEELAALGDLDIDCFADGLDRSSEPPTVPDGLDVYDARSLLRVEAVTAGYDDVVYVLGNGEFHTAALESLRHRRGMVLAHEVRLSGLYRFSAGSMAAVPEGVAGTIRDMYGPLLPEGVAATGEVSPLETELYGLLMAREVMALADRFFVTSPAAARLARIEAGPELASRDRRGELRHRDPPAHRRSVPDHRGHRTDGPPCRQLRDRRPHQAAAQASQCLCVACASPSRARARPCRTDQRRARRRAPSVGANARDRQAAVLDRAGIERAVRGLDGPRIGGRAATLLLLGRGVRGRRRLPVRRRAHRRERHRLDGRAAR